MFQRLKIGSLGVVVMSGIVTIALTLSACAPSAEPTDSPPPALSGSSDASSASTLPGPLPTPSLRRTLIWALRKIALARR